MNSNVQDFTVGKALALLAGHLKGKELQSQSFSSAYTDFFQILQGRMKALLKEPETVRQILSDFPDECCESENSALADNIDFFVAHLVVGPHSGINSKHCVRLSSHLNNCFRCFETYCDVTRDFCLGTQNQQ